MNGRSKENENENENVCMICLQNGAHIIQLHCKCRMVLHSKCWEQFCNTQNVIEKFLVCHKQKRNQTISEGIDNSTFQNRCVACCCCCLLTEFFLQFI